MKCNLDKKDLKLEWLMFDFDNTLVDFHEASRLSFDQSLIDFEIVQKPNYYQIYGEINAKIWGEFEEKKITAMDIRKRRFTEFFEAVQIENIDGLEFNTQYLRNIIKFTHLDPDILAFLKRLKQKYKLSIITNGLKEVQRARIEKCGITELFDSIVVSDEIGIAKPDKGYFEYAMNTLNEKIEKSKVLVIGDSLKSDISGAKSFGLKSCYINADGKAERNVADIVISNVLELEPVLDDLYIPVNCDWYDYLEIYSMHKSLVSLIYEEGGIKVKCETKIEDLYAKNKEEFAVLSSGIHVRLDHIIDIKRVESKG